MIDIKFVTVPGCAHCEKAKEVFAELQPQYPQMRIEEIQPSHPMWQELISQHGIFSSPGIIINGELFSTGGLDKKAFVAKLESLKAKEASST